MSQILDLIFQIPEHSGSPLFLPALFFWVFASMQRRQLRDIHDIMSRVQLDTGLLDGFLKVSTSPDVNSSIQRRANYDDLHSQLVEQHARLTIGLTEYVGDLGTALERGLERIRVIRGDWKLPIDTEHERDFQQYIFQMVAEGKAALHHRNRLLSRIDIQLKVVGAKMPLKDGR
jgi:hypothetical protein